MSEPPVHTQRRAARVGVSSQHRDVMAAFGTGPRLLKESKFKKTEPVH